MKKLYSAVEELLGPDALMIINKLEESKELSEEAIAKSVKTDIQGIRPILYRLHEHNLVDLDRRRDKKTGLYITFWNVNPDNYKHVYKRFQQSKLDKLTNRLKEESASEYYMCRNACKRADFDTAANFGFKCPECGQLMNPMDNSRTIEFLNERIEELKKGLIQG